MYFTRNYPGDSHAFYANILHAFHTRYPYPRFRLLHTVYIQVIDMLFEKFIPTISKLCMPLKQSKPKAQEYRQDHALIFAPAPLKNVVTFWTCVPNACRASNVHHLSAVPD